MPTMGCQDSVSEPDSSSALAGHSSQGHARRAATEAGRERNGEAEGPRSGFDCTECTDKATGKGRLGQGNGEAGSGLLLPQEDLTHPSDHQIAALVKAGTQSVRVQPEPEAEGWSPKSQAPSNGTLFLWFGLFFYMTTGCWRL